MTRDTARNVAIVVSIALVVWLLPGGGEGAGLVRAVLNAAFIVVMLMILGILYRQYRGEIFGLGDQWRFGLYAAIGVAVPTISITGRMWDTGGGALLWCALMGSCAYLLYVIWTRYRSYT